MESLRNLLITKTLSKLSLVAVTVWSGFEVVLFSIFAGIEGGESSRFRCNISNTNDNADFIKEKCFGEYEQKYIKLPVCGLVIINFLVIALIPVIYSYISSAVWNQDDRFEGKLAFLQGVNS